MRPARFHEPDYLSPPERFAQRHCRTSGPPNERDPGGHRGLEGSHREATTSHESTAHAAHLQHLRKLYGGTAR